MSTQDGRDTPPSSLQTVGLGGVGEAIGQPGDHLLGIQRLEGDRGGVLQGGPGVPGELVVTLRTAGQHDRAGCWSDGVVERGQCSPGSRCVAVVRVHLVEAVEDRQDPTVGEQGVSRGLAYSAGGELHDHPVVERGTDPGGVDDGAGHDEGRQAQPHGDAHLRSASGFECSLGSDRQVSEELQHENGFACAGGSEHHQAAEVEGVVVVGDGAQ